MSLCNTSDQILKRMVYGKIKELNMILKSFNWCGKWNAANRRTLIFLTDRKI